MFEQRGFEAGQRDGRNDALSKRRYRPRPGLGKAVISVRYQEAYLRAYARAYFDTQRAMIQQETRHRRLFEERALQLRSARRSVTREKGREGP